MTKITFTVIFSLFLFFAFYHPDSAAITDTPVREVNIEGRYSMRLPDYLTEGYGLNSEASLQYQNEAKEVYIIVIDESKQEFKDVFMNIGEYDTSKTVLTNYASAQMESIRENMSKVTKESMITSIETRSGPALVYNSSSLQDGIDDTMAFKVAFFEGRYNLYMIMAWTFDRTFALYEEDMTNMIKSFKELSGAVRWNKTEGDFRFAYPPYMTLVTPTAGAKQELYSSEYDLHIAIFAEPIPYWDSVYTAQKIMNMSLLQYFSEEQRRIQKNNLLAVRGITDFTHGRANGLDTQTFSMFAKPDKSSGEMYYKTRFIAGKKQLYIIRAWTPTKLKANNEATINDVMASFMDL